MEEQRGARRPAAYLIFSAVAIPLSVHFPARGTDERRVRKSHAMSVDTSPRRVLDLASGGRYGILPFLFSVPAAVKFTPNSNYSMW